MCKVSMSQATIVASSVQKDNARFSHYEKNFWSNIKFTKEIQKCVQVGFEVADNESVEVFVINNNIVFFRSPFWIMKIW